MQTGSILCWIINKKSVWCFAIIVPLLFFSIRATGQDRLKTPIKLKIEDGDFENVSVVMKNNTTGESNTIPGSAKFDLDLKVNCEYVISFVKPGYITKKIALNTNAPADRVSQGFYPFNFEVVLFKQYEGVNIVIFNQPVGKISYNRLIDDFDYDTDYTKQIQSALKAAEEEIKKKQAEERANAAQLEREEAQKKAEAERLEKLAAQEKLAAEKKAADDAKAAAAQAAKDQKALEEQQKKEAKAQADAEKQRARAQMEEDERNKAKAYAEEEERKKNAAGGGEDARPAGVGGEGNDQPATASASGSGNDSQSGKAGTGSGNDGAEKQIADANKRKDAGISKAAANTGIDEGPAASSVKKTEPIAAKTDESQYEVLPDISVEEINESNRTITRVTVRKNQKETVFSKVHYTWGGVYYFRQNMSISESLYFMNTGRR